MIFRCFVLNTYENLLGTVITSVSKRNVFYNATFPNSWFNKRLRNI